MNRIEMITESMLEVNRRLNLAIVRLNIHKDIGRFRTVAEELATLQSHAVTCLQHIDDEGKR